MKGVTPEVIAEVRMHASILDIVSETVVLKRAGAQYKGLCPFHTEKGPSFYVTPEKGIYKCFGCGEGGDVFAFVQKTKGLNFIDSVRELAQRYGVKLVESAQEQQEYDRRSQILLLYQQASEYYIKLLQDPREGIIGRKYLEDRGLTAEMIERFKLGYAPNTWDGLLNYLTEKTKASPATLEEAGLVRKRQETSGHYDLFRNRLMIPICDSEGRVIAFGGRTLGDDSAKYVNSPESPIYTKSHHLFGYNLAKQAIKEKDSVIVVEGYFDVITSHQYGFTNTVAPLGTALTEAQAKLLVRYTDSKRVYLSFDADTAGATAIERGAKTLNQIAEGVGIELRVINIPGGKDPDECLRSGAEGQAAFQKAITDAALMIDYQLEKAVAGINLDKSTGRIDAASRIVPILAVIKNSVARGEYVRNWAMQLRLREEEILADVSQYRAANRIDVPRNFGPGGYGQGGQSQGGYRNYQNGGGYQNKYQNGQRNNYQNQRGDDGGGGGYQSRNNSAANYQKPPTIPEYDPNEDDGGFGSAGPRAGAGAGGLDEDREIPGGGQGGGGFPGRRNFGGGQGGGQGNFQNGQQGPGFPAKAQFTRQSNKKFGGKGNFKDKKPEFADEEGLPMPPSAMGRPANKRVPGSGSFEAEILQLALFLTSREDYDKAAQHLADDLMLTPVHQRIKAAIDGIGPNFATIEDLRMLLQDRLAPDSEAARQLIEIILKAEDFVKQKVPVLVVLLDSRARILKERLEVLKSEFSRLMSKADMEGNDSEAMALQSRIIELTQLDSVVLSKIETLEDIEKVKRSLDAIESAHSQTTKMETRV
ncbi:MAG: DNA primase [Cyanobacteria bacterium REEB67]|nr:DNA primase [Cyanobacteria bacterium REEB67]